MHMHSLHMHIARAEMPRASVQAALEPAPQHTLDEGKLEAIGADVTGAAATLARDGGAGAGTMSTQMIDGSGIFASSQG